MTNKENFSQSIIESEIDIKDENPFISTEPANVEASDSSDIEVIAVCQSTTFNTRNNLLRPIYKRKKPKTKNILINNFVSQDEKSVIKEEIIISDESDCSDHNNIYDVKAFISNNSKINLNSQEKHEKQDESLSAIILNCPRCNKTEKVFSITIKSNCKTCNVNMYYICNKCNYKYDSMPSLYRHKKLQCQYIESKKKPKLSKMSMMKCNNCNQAKKVLNLPRNPSFCSVCRYIMIYACVICSKTYTSYSGIYSHTRRYCQLKHRAYYCNDCSYGCTKQKTLIRHLTQNHKDHFVRYDVFCSKCNKAFGDNEQLKRHEILCGLPFYHCKFCNYKPKVCGNVEKHLLAQHREKIEEEGLDNILIYISQNSQPKEKPVIVAKEKITDMNHMKSLHCPNCNRNYEYYRSASNCLKCNKSYLFECICCSKRFITSLSLQRHVRRNHSELKFKCEKCNKGFSCIGDINMHRKMCGTEQHYHCKLCSFQTRYKQSLRSHVYKLHNSKRVSFKCSTCGITYKTNRAMKRHNKIGCGQ